MGLVIKKWLPIIGVGFVIWFIPVPAGVKPIAWQVLALFLATIVGFILQPLPMGALAIISLTIAGFLNLAKLGDLLLGFSNSTVWLIVVAYALSRGFSKTGLGRRIAYNLINIFGDKTLKLGYSLMASEYILCTAIPSTAARGGAVMFPIIKSLASAFDSEPGPSAKKIGSYLIQVGFQCNTVSGALFLTSMVANPLCLAFAAQALKVQLTWFDWAFAAIVPGTIAMLAIPAIIYRLCPPTIKETPEAPALAKRELTKMGPLSRDEKILCIVFIATIFLWATAQWTKLNSTLIALASCSTLLLFQVLTWQDVVGEHGAWDIMIWIGALITLAGLLTKHGLIAWFSKMIAASLVGIPWLATLFLVILAYLYSHYLFASQTAHITALYPAMVAVAGAGGVPPAIAALSLGFFSNFCACLTHYGHGGGPIFFGANYVDQGKWWQIGFSMSLVYLFCWLGIGLVWWKVIGLW